MSDQADIKFPNTQSGTGIVYDSLFLKHTHATHPERAQRLIQIIKNLEKTALNEAVFRLPSRDVEPHELMLNHDKSYIERVKEASLSGSGKLDPDTYYNEHTYEAAIRAVGSTVAITEAVLDGRLKNGFSLVRPPGHHALEAVSMGFCLFNNIAVAAKVAKKSNVNRIAIIDFDVHHGNGTQAVFEADPNVLFVSSHQYPYWPGSGRIDETGRGEGEGFTLNIPFTAGAGDECVKAAYSQVVFPKIRQFEPELIMISAGYDAHWIDPLAGLSLSSQGFVWLSQQLIALSEELSDGKIVFCLEGGYHLTSLASGVANSLKALLKRDDFEDQLGPSPEPEPGCSGLIDELKRVHKLV